jgi:phosphoglycerate dehydrogenase-like enzyme
MSDTRRLPGDDSLVIHFAHVAYRLAERFALRGTGIAHFQTWSREDTLARIAEGHVLVLSGFWSGEMLEGAANLRFVQVCAAGYDQFDLDALGAPARSAPSTPPPTTEMPDVRHPTPAR